ncbi:hypothetical protein I4U23_022910 [Adineta vaga]|nr:hypothetical protein I4U23_022910 [Adineta vaga]
MAMSDRSKIYKLNRNIGKIREDLIELKSNDSIRSPDLDIGVIIRIRKLRTSYNRLTYEQYQEVKEVYSFFKTKKTDLIGISLQSEHHQFVMMNIGKTSTEVHMTPRWFKSTEEEEKEVLKTIKYPSNINDHRPYNTIACFRTKNNETVDFTKKPLEVKADSSETLVLALDVFIKEFGGKLTFTTENLSFEESHYRTACGIADLGSAHLFVNEQLSSAKFSLLLDLNYDQLAKSNETMKTFVLSFVDDLAKDLSCSNDFIRIISVEKSTKIKGKTQINLVLTTPEKTKTEELAELFQTHARQGFSKATNVLYHIIPDDYQCQWMPILSYLQLKPSDFDRRFNFDYRQEGLPKTQLRGNLKYYLPNQWYRHALKVDDKYQDEPKWLGSINGPGEWPVAFHGTQSLAVKGIAELGLLTSSIKRDAMLDEAIQQKGQEVNRPGLYVATRCNGGSYPQYTNKFEVNISAEKIETFEVVFQCRVRPNSYTIHKRPVKVGEAWRIVDPTAVRPYGILLKNANITALDDTD